MLAPFWATIYGPEPIFILPFFFNTMTICDTFNVVNYLREFPKGLFSHVSLTFSITDEGPSSKAADVQCGMSR